MASFFKNYSHAEFTYLLLRLKMAKYFLEYTTLEMVSEGEKCRGTQERFETDFPLTLVLQTKSSNNELITLLLKKTTLFYQPLHFNILSPF